MAFNMDSRIGVGDYIKEKIKEEDYLNVLILRQKIYELKDGLIDLVKRVFNAFIAQLKANPNTTNAIVLEKIREFGKLSKTVEEGAFDGWNDNDSGWWVIARVFDSFFNFEKPDAEKPKKTKQKIIIDPDPCYLIVILGERDIM